MTVIYSSCSLNNIVVVITILLSVIIRVRGQINPIKFPDDDGNLNVAAAAIVTPPTIAPATTSVTTTTVPASASSTMSS